MTIIFNNKRLIFTLGDDNDFAKVTYTRNGSTIEVSRNFAIGIVRDALQQLQNQNEQHNNTGTNPGQENLSVAITS